MKKLAVTALVLLTLMPGTAALAHSALIWTDPAANSTIQKGPRLVNLGFDIQFLSKDNVYQADFQIKDPKGHVVTPKCSNSALRTLQGAYLFQDLGTYTVEWRAISDDGHVIGGSYRFNVDSSTPSPAEIGQLCQAAGMQVGQIKKPSNLSFEEINLETYLQPAIAGTLLLAFIGGVFAWRKKKSRRGQHRA